MLVRSTFSAVVLMVLVLGLTAVAAGCGGGGDGPPEVPLEGTEQAPGEVQAERTEETAADIHVVLTEDSIQASPDSASLGSVTFLIENRTEEEWTFLIGYHPTGSFLDAVTVPSGRSEKMRVDLERVGEYLLGMSASAGPGWVDLSHTTSIEVR